MNLGNCVGEDGCNLSGHVRYSIIDYQTIISCCMVSAFIINLKEMYNFYKYQMIHFYFLQSWM